MAPDLDSELRMLRDETRAFAENEVLPEANERDPEGEPMSDDLVNAIGEMGFMGLLAPEEYGGLGMGPRAYCLVVEELSRAWMSAGTLASRGQHIPGATDEQKREYLPKFASGDVIQAVSMSESGAGSDVAAMSTTAEKDGDEYVIDGQKMWCTGAKLADSILVYAKTDPGERHRGISGFIVDKGRRTFDLDGLTGTKLDTIGFNGWGTYQLDFDGVRVPEEKLVGGENGKNRAFYHLMKNLEINRFQAASRGVGVAQGALEDSVEYARDREQFGQPIGEFQAIRFKLADMASRVEAARQLLHYAARKKETDDGRLDSAARCDKVAGMAKYFSSNVAETVTSEGIQIHGGNGYTTDYPVSRYWRDARMLRIVDGTDEIQKRIIADHLFEDGVRNE